MPPTDCRVTPCRYAVIFSTARGSQPISRAPSLRTTPDNPSEPYDSMNSDQPTTPSSVLILRNEKSRQPALQCRSSILVMRMSAFLDHIVRGQHGNPLAAVADCTEHLARMLPK